MYAKIGGGSIKSKTKTKKFSTTFEHFSELPQSCNDQEMESDYHNPYDHHLGDSGMNGARLPEGVGGVVVSGNDHLQNHYEAPSCLVRNPSGSLFIPSSGNIIHQIIISSYLMLAFNKNLFKYYYTIIT